MFASWCAGCATMLHGSTQAVHFDSIPAPATVRVDAHTITTPGEMSLSRGKSYEVIFEKPGYLRAETQIRQMENDAIWWNVLFGGLVGMIVDYSSGAAYDLVPSAIEVTLTPEPPEAGVSEGDQPQPPPVAVPARVSVPMIIFPKGQR